MGLPELSGACTLPFLLKSVDFSDPSQRVCKKDVTQKAGLGRISLTSLNSTISGPVMTFSLLFIFSSELTTNLFIAERKRLRQRRKNTLCASAWPPPSGEICVLRLHFYSHSPYCLNNIVVTELYFDYKKRLFYDLP